MNKQSEKQSVNVYLWCALAHCLLYQYMLYNSEEEALADLNAFNREYENDNSWEQLQEDEYGHLRPLVSLRPTEIIMCVCPSFAEVA